MSALRSETTRAGSRASSILKTFDAYAALRAIRDACSLRATVKAVAFVLIARANGAGETWPAYSTIGRDAGVDRRTAITAIAELEREGVIEKIVRFKPDGDRDTNTYRFAIGRPARPREAPADVDATQEHDEAEAHDEGDVAQLVAEVEAPVEAPVDADVAQLVAEGVVIVDPQGGDRGSPDLLRETSREERGRTLVKGLSSEGDPWTVLVAEHERTRHARYGFRGLKEPVSAERRAAVTACLIEAGDAGVAIAPLVRGWFDLPGRDGYLREKRHPFRCLLADLDGLIAAAVSKVRQKARERERERGELAAVAPRQEPSERPAPRGFLEGAAAVLAALGRRT